MKRPAAALMAPPVLPHGGDPQALQAWWARLGDPLLLELIVQGQAQHPSMEAALARVAQARATAQAAGIVGRPELAARAQFGRQRIDEPASTPVLASVLSGGLDARWELDLFGRQQATRALARARVKASEAGWHEARTVLAAEIVGAYFTLRACEATLQTRGEQRRSAERSAQLIALRGSQGFETGSEVLSARSRLREAEHAEAAQGKACELARQPLLTLTRSDAAGLRARWTETPLAPDARQSRARERWSLPAPAAEDTDPAVLAQRPDVAAAEQALLAAAAETGLAEADRWPRLVTELQWRSARSEVSNTRTSLRPWSIGLDLLVPLLDGGARQAAVEAARARHLEARAQWVLKAGEALEEMRSARLRWEAAVQAVAQAERAEAEQARLLQAAERAFSVGTVNRLDVESARREALAEHLALQQAWLARSTAWLGYYKAVGGAWGGAVGGNLGGNLDGNAGDANVGTGVPAWATPLRSSGVSVR